MSLRAITQSTAVLITSNCPHWGTQTEISHSAIGALRAGLRKFMLKTNMNHLDFLMHLWLKDRKMGPHSLCPSITNLHIRFSALFSINQDSFQILCNKTLKREREIQERERKGKRYRKKCKQNTIWHKRTFLMSENANYLRLCYLKAVRKQIWEDPRAKRAPEA